MVEKLYLFPESIFLHLKAFNHMVESFDKRKFGTSKISLDGFSRIRNKHTLFYAYGV